MLFSSFHFIISFTHSKVRALCTAFVANCILIDRVFVCLKDFGKDVKSANNLIKKQQLLEADITSHEERVNEILLQAAEFVEADHFEKDEIEDRAKAVAERY